MTGVPLSLDALGPPPWRPSLLPAIRRANQASGTRIVVLDDDPLGGQCVHDVPVLTSWRSELLEAELRRSPMFLLHTNTRALSRAAAAARATEVGLALREAQRATGLTVTPVWRSDSTLRGHFAWEIQPFDAAFGEAAAPPPVYVFLPYFGEGGRFTLNDTQYVLQHGALIPAADTEFARDPAFAYTQSHLPAWVEAQSEGRFRASGVVCISITDLRDGGAKRVAETLSAAPAGGAVVVNATADSDLEVFVFGLQQSEVAGRRFLCTGAAPFIRVRAGMPQRPAVTRAEMGIDGAAAGGLIVVGSYADRTKAQVAAVSASAATTIALELHRLQAPEVRTAEINRASSEVARHLLTGEDVILRSSLDYAPSAGAAIADGLAAVVDSLAVRPRYLLVKGGSTASRLATDVLGVTRAIVLGQLMAGVPVWRLGDQSRWPGLPYAIFPGNVGTEESLAEALRLLRGG